MNISTKTVSLIRKIAISLVFMIPVTVLVAPVPPFSLIVSLFFFPYISAKTFAFRILIDLIMVLVCTLAFLDKQYRPRWSWLSIAGLVFVMVIGLADVFGVNPTRSLWSNFERMEGFVTLLHWAGYFVALATLLKTEKIWIKFFYTNLIVAGLVSLYGLFQTVGLLTIQQGGTRIDGSFGNASYFGTYMFFAIGIATLMFIGKKHLIDPRPKMHYLLYITTVLLFGFLLYLTGTRGALLGLVSTIILTVIGLLIVQHDKKDRKIQIVLGAVLLMTVLSGVLLWGFRDSTFVQSKPMLARAASSFNLQDKTIESRLTIWRNIVWPGFKERPILGWGQENFIAVFGKYYDPSMYNQEPWFDRTHNNFLDWLIAGGLIGLLSYLAIFLSWLWCLIKINKDKLTSGQKVVLLAIVAGYSLQNMVIFDNLTSCLWFVALLAYVHVLYTAGEDVSDKNKLITLGAKRMTALVGSVLLILVVLYSTNLKPIYANVSLIGALQNSAIGSYESSLGQLKNALAVGHYGETEIRENIVRIASSALADSKVSNQLKQAYINLILEEYNKQFKTYPDDVRSRLGLANFLAQFGQFKDALSLLDQAAKIAPKKQIIFLMRARIYGTMKDYPNALKDAKYAFELDKSYVEARMLYANLAGVSGNVSLANELKSQVSVDSLNIDEQINYYVTKKDYSKLVDLWQSKLTSDPNNVQNYVSFAASLYATNQRDKAVSILEEARTKFPDLTSNINQMISQIKAGTVVLQ